MADFLNRIKSSLESFFTMNRVNTFIIGATLTSIYIHRYFGEFAKGSELSFPLVFPDSLLSTDSLFFDIGNLYEILFLLFFLQVAIFSWNSKPSEEGIFGESKINSPLDETELLPIESSINSPLLSKMDSDSSYSSLDETKVSPMESNINSSLDATQVKSSTKSNSTNSTNSYSIPVVQPYNQQSQMIFSVSIPSISSNPQFQIFLHAVIVSEIYSNTFSCDSEDKLTEKKSKKKRRNRKFKRNKH